MEKWDSLFIFFISGTGNARASSVWIKEEAEKQGLRTVVQQIDRKEKLVLPVKEDKALIGFAFPTHGFNSAPVMIRFIAGFPRGSGREIFLLNTRAGMKLSKIFLPGISGVALLLPAFILWLKGYRCIGFRPVDLPSNWIPLHPGIKEKVIRSIFNRCEKIVRNFAVTILSGKRVYTGLFSFPLDLLISPIALGYYAGGRFFLSKTFVATDRCNNCGLCIKECPTSSIKMVAGRPYWKLTCESCMRCLNFCPNRAIEAAHGMAIAFWIIFTAANAQFILLLMNFLKINPDFWWWKLAAQIIGIGGMILITAALYSIMHRAMGFKPVRYLVRFTSLTTLPCWRRYSFLKKRSKSCISEDQL